MNNKATIEVPVGVKLTSLETYIDSRGSLTELFRAEWISNQLPVQWNIVQSKANSIRGMHVHRNHFDYLFVPYGRMLLGLKDLRRNSSTYLTSTIVTLDSQNFMTCFIPPGVGHCFYFPIESTLLYSLSHYWSLKDDLGCMWNDPDIGLNWPDIINPHLSERDSNAPSLNELLKQLEEIKFPG